jgi:hypothetical protein
MMAEEETSWHGEAFGKRNLEEETKHLRASLLSAEKRLKEKIGEEAGYRSDLAKRVRKLEKQTAVLMQTAVIGVGGFFFSQVAHYWKLGEWWIVLAIIGFMIVVVKLYIDAEKVS